MRIAFISDIHGNAIALESVLKDIKTKSIDKIIVLGDICFRGPEPKRSLDLVRSLNTEVIKGNADEWLVRGIKQGEVPDVALASMSLEQQWTVNQLSNQDLEYLDSLPLSLTCNLNDKIKISAFHATPDSLFESVNPNDNDEKILTKLMERNLADIYLYGHIHLPFVRFINGKCVANTGSVGLPFDGLNHASYLIVEGINNQFNIGIQRVKYDVKKVEKQLIESNYPNLDIVVNMINTGSK